MLTTISTANNHPRTGHLCRNAKLLSGSSNSFAVFLSRRTFCGSGKQTNEQTVRQGSGRSLLGAGVVERGKGESISDVLRIDKLP